MKEKHTPEKILTSAEQLFAERGFTGSTLREVTERAGVNLAAVNYHFGTKEGLFMEMLRRRITPINARRMELLDQALAESGGESLTLETLFKIILEPLTESLIKEGNLDEVFLGIIARSIVDPSEFIQHAHRGFFKDISERIGRELQRAVGNPELSEEDISWRIYFSISTMLGSLIQHRRIEHYFPGIRDPRDMEAMTRQLIRFVCAGMESAKPRERPGSFQESKREARA